MTLMIDTTEGELGSDVLSTQPFTIRVLATDGYEVLGRSYLVNMELSHTILEASLRQSRMSWLSLQ